ncbi:hypothetical protein HK102_000386 [Quaeritorhiza haematococci]|nr:hypothetical protein HK102_000386 [Quaeritorhiza haematococci]
MVRSTPTIPTPLPVLPAPTSPNTPVGAGRRGMEQNQEETVTCDSCTLVWNSEPAIRSKLVRTQSQSRLDRLFTSAEPPSSSSSASSSDLPPNTAAPARKTRTGSFRERQLEQHHRVRNRIKSNAITSKFRPPSYVLKGEADDMVLFTDAQTDEAEIQWQWCVKAAVTGTFPRTNGQMNPKTFRRATTIRRRNLTRTATTKNVGGPVFRSRSATLQRKVSRTVSPSESSSSLPAAPWSVEFYEESAAAAAAEDFSSHAVLDSVNRTSRKQHTRTNSNATDSAELTAVQYLEDFCSQTPEEATRNSTQNSSTTTAIPTYRKSQATKPKLTIKTLPLGSPSRRSITSTKSKTSISTQSPSLPVTPLLNSIKALFSRPGNDQEISTDEIDTVSARDEPAKHASNSPNSVPISSTPAKATTPSLSRPPVPPRTSSKRVAKLVKEMRATEQQQRRKVTDVPASVRDSVAAIETLLEQVLEAARACNSQSKERTENVEVSQKDANTIMAKEDEVVVEKAESPAPRGGSTTNSTRKSFMKRSLILLKSAFSSSSPTASVSSPTITSPLDSHFGSDTTDKEESRKSKKRAASSLSFRSLLKPQQRKQLEQKQQQPEADEAASPSLTVSGPIDLEDGFTPLQRSISRKMSARSVRASASASMARSNAALVRTNTFGNSMKLRPATMSNPRPHQKQEHQSRETAEIAKTPTTMETMTARYQELQESLALIRPLPMPVAEMPMVVPTPVPSPSRRPSACSSSSSSSERTRHVPEPATISDHEASTNDESTEEGDETIETMIQDQQPHQQLPLDFPTHRSLSRSVSSKSTASSGFTAVSPPTLHRVSSAKERGKEVEKAGAADLVGLGKGLGEHPKATIIVDFLHPRVRDLYQDVVLGRLSFDSIVKKWGAEGGVFWRRWR